MIISEVSVQWTGHLGMFRSFARCTASRGPTSSTSRSIRSSIPTFGHRRRADCRFGGPSALVPSAHGASLAAVPARRGPGSRRPGWRRRPRRGNRTMGPGTRQAVAGPTLAIIGFGNTSQLKIAREQQTRDREDQRHWYHDLPLGCTPRNSIHEYSKHKIRGQPPDSIVDRRATKDSR